MSSDAEEFVFYQLANARVLEFPFPHFYIHPIFPDPFYQALRKRLPDVSAYRRLDETGTVTKDTYTERFICTVEELEERESTDAGDSFWFDLNVWLMGASFARLVMHKFRDPITDRFGLGSQIHTATDARMVRDFSNYAISPHTDTPRKLVSLLFYLPPDESMLDLGTSIYAPKDPSFRCEGTGHHSFDRFNKVATMPYRPNSLFGFFKTDRAFHGVDRIAAPGVVRDLLLYNIYAQKVVPAQPPGLAKTPSVWPWEQASA
ncbi:MAG: hypothetical protein HC807_01585 [Gammaproteobacteria bacterium]|nr:hypothetical protein [Gammaproteobacteria bacterium]